MSVGFFALLDDITVLLDDVAAMSKVAAKKTAGILGDDLAVNAEKSSKFDSNRELPILYKITLGSFINKLILLPLIFTLSYFLPQAIIPILLVGGMYLAYEGFEKVLEFVLHKNNHNSEQTYILKDNDINFENKKIKSAILTDFILSIEIVIITLSAVLNKPFMVQIIVVSLISILAVVFVYGLVGILIRLDDVGFWLQRKTKQETFFYKVGGVMIKSLPILIKVIGVIGTIAMFLVAGGIFIHNIDFLHHLSNEFNLWLLNDLIYGFIIGFIVFIVIELLIFLKNFVKKILI